MASDESRGHADATAVRERTDADINACARLVEAVRSRDSYPPYLPDNDYVRLLTQPRARAAFVATIGDEAVGHVALHPYTGSETEQLACNRLGVEPAQLGVVARLFTAVDRRREGIGQLLLRTATDAARARGLAPVLDVWVELRPAIALYESASWERLGTVRVVLPTGEHDVAVFAGPR